MTREVIRYKLNELRMMLNDGEHTEEQGILVDIIKELDKAENKGEWIHVVDSYYKDGREKESHWECSKCGSRKSWWGESKFCSNCGADMREPKREKIRCNTCKNNDDEFSGECYECIKGIFDHYEPEEVEPNE